MNQRKPRRVARVFPRDTDPTEALDFDDLIEIRRHPLKLGIARPLVFDFIGRYGADQNFVFRVRNGV